ncbi:unnamed protein product [Dovyalis caffra]|uniref:Uncharacterized protein n=1 Tax=Dovyalis caffra TaxID=77055 RepID=A0AAV1QSR0_9ROSI|nr:unnamed protein product [Dovyalis caffra]
MSRGIKDKSKLIEEYIIGLIEEIKGHLKELNWKPAEADEGFLIRLNVDEAKGVQREDGKSISRAGSLAGKYASWQLCELALAVLIFNE